MPKSSEGFAWKRVNSDSRDCYVCGEYITFRKDDTRGLAVESFYKRMRHLDCGRTVVMFIHDGDEAGLLLEAAVRDYEDARRAA